VVVLCVGLVCRHSHGPSLLLEKLSGSIGGKAEPGIPRTWISDKDMADSPMLHSSSSSASLPGQGILSSAMHPERISLASAPPSGALAAERRQGQEKSHLAPKAASGPALRREDKGDPIPSKVEDLKNQGLKQVAPFFAHISFLRSNLAVSALCFTSPASLSLTSSLMFKTGKGWGMGEGTIEKGISQDGHESRARRRSSLAKASSK